MSFLDKCNLLRGVKPTVNRNHEMNSNYYEKSCNTTTPTPPIVNTDFDWGSTNFGNQNKDSYGSND